MPDAVIFRHQLFRPSEPFITQQAESLTGFRPVYLGRTRHGEPPEGASSRALVDLERYRPFRRRLWQVLTRDVTAYRELLGDREPRIVHAHFGVEGVYALPLAKELRVPLVTTFHGFDATTSLVSLLCSRKPSWIQYARLRPSLARHGDLFVCVSDFIRERVLALGFPEARTVTHYIGVDPRSAFPPQESEHPMILHVARLVEKKGTRYLLEAFARLHARIPEAELVIIGDGPLRASLEALAARRRIGHRVRFLGSRPHREVLERMASAWLFCLPSVTASTGDSEGLAMVFLEAAMHSVPSVGTLHAGIPEAVESGTTGYLVPERNPVALYEALLELLEDSEKRSSMGAAAKRRVESRFDIGLQSSRLEAIYRKLGEGGR